MKMNSYNYQPDWQDYAFPTGGCRLATKKDLAKEFSLIDLTKSPFPASGIPIEAEKSAVFVNNETENTIVFGETGSKKTRCIIRPTMATLIQAGESMFVTDVKGELSTDPKIRGLLQERGYHTVFLDFKSFAADGYNILEYPFSLYCRGLKDKAMASAVAKTDFLSSIYNGTKVDPYWQLMSNQHLIPIINLLFEICSQNKSYYPYINMLTLSTFTNTEGTEDLEEIVNFYLEDVHTNATEMLRSVLSTAERTKASIVSTTASLLKDFLIQENLLKMLSVSTFSITEMYRVPTCVFLIIPDETSAYDSIAGLIIDDFYQQLIEEYSLRYQNSKQPPCRINWLCDEFCNLKINDMKAKISASRSREMRWTLVCQSKSQLENSYPQDASTILGNCKNIFFLQSSDYEMLSYISVLSGKTLISEYPDGENLLPVDRLKKLKKSPDYKEAVFLRDNIVYLAKLPDIDQYAFLDPYASPDPCPIPVIKKPKVKAYSPHMILSDLRYKKIPVPFQPPQSSPGRKETNRGKISIFDDDFDDFESFSDDD